jgi:hypothetical protein
MGAAGTAVAAGAAKAVEVSAFIATVIAVPETQKSIAGSTLNRQNGNSRVFMAFTWTQISPASSLFAGPFCAHICEYTFSTLVRHGGGIIRKGSAIIESSRGNRFSNRAFEAEINGSKNE